MQISLIVSLVIVVGAQSSIVEREKTPSYNWSYSGQTAPKYWPTLGYPLCSGQKQSPINIISVLSVKKAVPPMYFVNYNLADSARLSNTGRTVMLTLPVNYSASTLGKMPLIRGGGLTDDYIFQQLHFHWGTVLHPGSEHVIGFRKYPAELHVVHYNSKYGDFNNATNHADGVAVLSVLLKVGIVDNAAFKPITDTLPNIPRAGDEVLVAKPFNLVDLLPTNPFSFFRYSGSLTTPGCQESVIWTVFKSPSSISIRQLWKFLLLRDAENQPITGNWRPTQSLNKRTVYSN